MTLAEPYLLQNLQFEQLPMLLYRKRYRRCGEVEFLYARGGLFGLFSELVPDGRRNGTCLLGQVHPDDRDFLLQAMRTAWRRSEALDVLFRVRDGSGWRWLRDIAHARPGSDDTMIWDGVFVDVTPHAHHLDEDRLRPRRDAVATDGQRDELQRVLIQRQLPTALENGLVRAAFQPIVDPATMALRSFEALVRWHDEGLGWLKPDVIVAVAEDDGLMGALFARMVRCTGEFLRRRRERGAARVPVSLNLSPSQLVGGDVAARSLLDLLHENGLEPADVRIEITETSILSDIHQAQRVLAEIAGIGVRIALDDFGVGYSSLTHLLRFPISQVKIDRSFIKRIDSDGTALSLTRAVIAMAESLGIEVVAEGVETREQLEFLRGANIYGVQGYLVSRAMPDDEALAWTGPATGPDRSSSPPAPAVLPESRPPPR